MTIKANEPGELRPQSYPKDGQWHHDPAIHRTVAEVRAEREAHYREQVAAAPSPLERFRRLWGHGDG